MIEQFFFIWGRGMSAISIDTVSDLLFLNQVTCDTLLTYADTEDDALNNLSTYSLRKIQKGLDNDLSFLTRKAHTHISRENEAP